MKIGELFVDLGLTNDNAVVKGLKRVSEAFGEVIHSSFQTKVGIAGALYGLERMTSAAAKTGSEFYKFRTAFGLSTKALQEWQHLARQYGAEEDIQGAIEGIQQAMAKMELGGGMPAAFGRLNIQTQGKNAFQVLDQIEKKIKKIDPKLGMELVSGLGISTSLFSAMRSWDRQTDRIDQSMIISDSSINRLQKINAQWANFWFMLKRISILSVSEFASPMIRTLKDVTTFIVDAVSWVKQLTKEFDGLRQTLMILGGLILAYFAPVTAALFGIAAIISKIQEFRNAGQKEKEKIFKNTIGADRRVLGFGRSFGVEGRLRGDLSGAAKGKEPGILESFSWAGKEILKAVGLGGGENVPEKMKGTVGGNIPENLAPNVSNVTGGNEVTNNNAKTTNIYLNDLKVSGNKAEAFEKSLMDTFNLSPARGGI